MSARENIDLNTGDYLTMGTSPVSITLTEQRIQILLSLAPILLDRDTWEKMSDSAWDSWSEGLSDMVKQLQDY